jgi:hypothetical protein
MGYLFYGFYKFAQIIGKKKDAELRAYFFFGLIQMTNLYSFAQVFILIFYQTELSMPSIYLPFIAGSIYGLNIFLFLRRDKYKLLIDKYQNESKSQNITNNIVTYLYIIGSFALFFYSKVSIVLIKFTN